MTLQRDQKFNHTQATALKKKALAFAQEMEIEKKIRYMLSHGNARYTDQGKQMALPGSGVVLFADFTGLNEYVTKVTHAETGNLVYHATGKGLYIERFRSGTWVRELHHEYNWLEWKTNNSKTADLVDRFGVLDDE